MTRSRFLLAFALGLGLNTSQAETFDLGTILPGTGRLPYDVDVTRWFSKGASFDDLFTFQLPQASRLHLGIFRSETPWFAWNTAGGGAFKYSLFSGADGTGARWDLGWCDSYCGNTSGINNRLDLGAGLYSIRVEGQVASSYQHSSGEYYSGSYGGGYRLRAYATAAPVPEPHEWVLLVAGLLVVGWALRRREATAIMASAG